MAAARALDRARLRRGRVVISKKRLYDLAGPRSRAVVDRARYRAGLLPRIAPRGADGACTAWPEPHRSCLVVSADLELAWAWRYLTGAPDPLGIALALAQRSRENTPPLLDLFRSHDLPVTWATVGHLFLESCERDGGRAHPELPRLRHFEHDLWTFREGDWFDDDPCTDFRRDPDWYAPDLVDAIVAADPRHEIGCHTFSHADFSDDNCPPEVARAELDATVAAAAARGIAIDTMVFPGNRSGNFDALSAAGIRGYRVHGRHHLGFPRTDALGMWQIPGGVSWEQPPGWRTRAWIDALRRVVDASAEAGALLHLWFHPSCDPVNVEEVFPAVLEHVTATGTGVWKATMRDVVEWCGTRQVA